MPNFSISYCGLHATASSCQLYQNLMERMLSKGMSVSSRNLRVGLGDVAKNMENLHLYRCVGTSGYCTFIQKMEQDIWLFL